MDSYAHVGLGGYDATIKNNLSNKLFSTYDPNNPLFRRNINRIEMTLLPAAEALTQTILSPTAIITDPADTGINGGDTNG